MPAVLIVIISAMATAVLLALALALESWLWRRDTAFLSPALKWGSGAWGKVLSISLALSVLGAIGVLSYTVASPLKIEKFTEFYILGLKNQAWDYPRKLMLGQEGKVIVGIINREQVAATYSVEITIGGIKDSVTAPILLNHEEKWEKILSFSPEKTGDKQKVAFLLYRQGQPGVYQELYLWVDVN